MYCARPLRWEKNMNWSEGRREEGARGRWSCLYIKQEGLCDSMVSGKPGLAMMNLTGGPRCSRKRVFRAQEARKGTK